MKYVRIEDKIVVVNYWCKDEQGYYTWLTVEWCQPKLYIYKKDIVAEADTIEELIDGYYLDIDNRPFEKAYTFNDLYEALEERQSWLNYSNRKGLDYDIVLYGFIKTNKGLIYVAKANNKGELELCWH